jgi:hypothetical protein
VERSKKFPGTWNEFFSRHGRVRNPEQFRTPPRCRCGCKRPVSWQVFAGRWRVYRKGCVPLLTDVPPHFSKTDMVEALGVTRRTVERRVNRGALPEPIRAVVPGFPGYFKVFLVEDFVTAEELEILRQVRVFLSRAKGARRAG